MLALLILLSFGIFIVWAENQAQALFNLSGLLISFFLKVFLPLKFVDSVIMKKNLLILFKMITSMPPNNIGFLVHK